MTDFNYIISKANTSFLLLIILFVSIVLVKMLVYRILRKEEQRNIHGFATVFIMLGLLISLIAMPAVSEEKQKNYRQNDKKSQQKKRSNPKESGDCRSKARVNIKAGKSPSSPVVRKPKNGKKISKQPCRER